MKKKRNVLILGAAGRDFHNFLVFYKNNPRYRVVCFTATQIPFIEDRIFPKELAGKGYPRGIPIYPESEMPRIIKEKKVDEVVFSYSDVSHEYVMHKASEAEAAGASFVLLGPNDTMLKSRKPVIAVTAARTGSGKSPVTRAVCTILEKKGKKPVIIRHPMPYGNLSRQAVQRFETEQDLELANATIEEREEYEQHLNEGRVVYAGIDYKRILRAAEKEADFIVWDGGNNDFPFVRPDLMITVVDPLRPGHELKYHPGETCVRMADVIVINKENTAPKRNITRVRKNVKKINPDAIIIDAESRISVDNPQVIAGGKRVLVIEDGPSITHGGMPYGAGYVAAKEFRCKIVNPKKKVKGSIKKAYQKYPHIGPVLPALGYSQQQLLELEQTINRIDCDAVIIATPVDLRKIIWIDQPSVHVFYRIKEIGRPTLKEVIEKKFRL